MALIKCPECGKEISDSAKVCPHCGYALKGSNALPVSMTATAVMSFVLAALCLWQSDTVSRLFAITNTKDPGGIIGILMAIILILSGVLAICLRNEEDEIVPLVCFAMCLLSAFIGVIFETAYADLLVWAAIISIFSILYFSIAVRIRLKYWNRQKLSN